MESENGLQWLTRVIAENSAAIEQCKTRSEKDPNSQFLTSTLQRLKDRQIVLLRELEALTPKSELKHPQLKQCGLTQNIM